MKRTVHPLSLDRVTTGQVLVVGSIPDEGKLFCTYDSFHFLRNENRTDFLAALCHKQLDASFPFNNSYLTLQGPAELICYIEAHSYLILIMEKHYSWTIEPLYKIHLPAHILFLIWLLLYKQGAMCNSHSLLQRVYFILFALMLGDLLGGLSLWKESMFSPPQLADISWWSFLFVSTVN